MHIFIIIKFTFDLLSFSLLGGSSLAIFIGVLLNKSIPKYLVNIGLFGGEDG